jgi:hypothetical protein
MAILYHRYSPNNLDTWPYARCRYVPLVLTTGTPTPILTIYHDQLAYPASLGPPRADQEVSCPLVFPVHSVLGVQAYSAFIAE